MLARDSFWFKELIVLIKCVHIYILHECSYTHVPTFGCMAASLPSPHLLPPLHISLQAAPGAGAAADTVEVLPWTVRFPTTVFLHSKPALQPKPLANKANPGSWYDFRCKKSGLSTVSSQTSAYFPAV